MKPRRAQSWGCAELFANVLDLRVGVRDSLAAIHRRTLAYQLVEDHRAEHVAQMVIETGEWRDRSHREGVSTTDAIQSGRRRVTVDSFEEHGQPPERTGEVN